MTKPPRTVRRLSYLAVAQVPGERAHSMQIAETCAALARHLDELELIVPRLGAQRGSSDVLPGVRLVRLLAPNFLPLGRWAPAWLMRILFDVQSSAFARLALARALVRALVRRRFDVYYTRSPFVAVAFAFMFGFRAVLELHVPPAGPMRRALLRLCRLFGCRFVAISDALRRRVAALLCVEPDEIGVAHDGYDPALFSKLPDRAETRRRLGLADETFAICYLGSAATLGAAKGVRFIAEAFRRAALPDATLLLAGIEQGEDALAGPDIRCLGRIPHEKIAALLAACDCAVVSFPENADYARAMSPLKLFEYLAAGLPIIAPDFPNLREVLDESCALLVPLTDAAALAAAMTRLRTDAALRSRLAAGAAERASAYTWDARAERLLAFLRLPAA